MSIFNDKALKSVAEAALKVLTQESEATHPKTDKEKKLAALAHPKDKVTHKDVLVGRGVLKKEEVEQLEELSKDTLQSYSDKALKDMGKSLYTSKSSKIKTRYKGVMTAARKMKEEVEEEQIEEASKYAKMFDTMYDKKMKKKEAEKTSKKPEDMKKKAVKEEVELDEAFPTVADAKKRMDAPKPSGGAGIKQGTRYGGSKQAPDVEDNDDDDKKPARGKYGARQNYKRSMKESFSEMINAYNEGGLKSLSQHLVIEEPDNEQFTKEFEDQKSSMEGKKKQPSVAAPSTQGVKNMPEEIELNADEINGVAIETLDEAAGKITHHVQKDKVDAHTAAMRDEGLGAKYRALPKTHPLHKTHMGITDVGDSDHGKHSEGEGISVSHYKNVMKSKMKEEVELEERSLTPGEKKEMEKNVKGMKKKLSGFKQRYGDRAKEVMYATATKMAKKD